MSHLNEKNQMVLTLPLLEFDTVEVSLKKNEIAYAHFMRMKWNHGNRVIGFNARERTSLPLSNFIDSSFRGLMEIVAGEIVHMETAKKQKDFQEHISATFLSHQDSYQFFPKLVEFMNSQADDYDEEIYDIISEQEFNNFSDCGFSLTPYDAPLTILTDNGVFLLNEYIFEESVESLLQGDQILIKIDEVLLLSIGTR